MVVQQELCMVGLPQGVIVTAGFRRTFSAACSCTCTPAFSDVARHAHARLLQHGAAKWCRHDCELRRRAAFTRLRVPARACLQ